MFPTTTLPDHYAAPLRSGGTNDWFSHTIDWWAVAQASPSNVLWVRYEDLLKNPYEQEHCTHARIHAPIPTHARCHSRWMQAGPRACPSHLAVCPSAGKHSATVEATVTTASAVAATHPIKAVTATAVIADCPTRGIGQHTSTTHHTTTQYPTTPNHTKPRQTRPRHAAPR